MLVIKVRSSEWCDVYIHRLLDEGRIVETRSIREIECVEGERGEEIDVEKLVQCFRDRDVDTVIAVECEYDFPHIIVLKDRKVLHYTRLERSITNPTALKQQP